MENNLTQSLVDFNPKFGNPGQPYLLYGIDVIRASLVRLFSAHIGCKSKIGVPSYGSPAIEILQEPMDEDTIFRLKNTFLSSISTHEPRVTVYPQDIEIYADLQNAAYQVLMLYRIPVISYTDEFKFQVKLSQNG